MFPAGLHSRKKVPILVSRRNRTNRRPLEVAVASPPFHVHEHRSCSADRMLGPDRLDGRPP